MGKALIFCGIKHCGKSTLGKTLARMLNIPFRDTDDMLEEKWQCSVREMYKSAGEETFRRRETELLKSLSAETPQVISLGGGALLKEENIPLIRTLGTIIWCDVDDRVAFERISRKDLPPFLAQAPDPFEEFQKRNKERREIFSAVCSLPFSPREDKSPMENCGELRKLLLEKGMIEK